MKKTTVPVRASHVSIRSATGANRSVRTPKRGRQFRHPKLRVEIEDSESTPYGGLSLATSLMERLKVAPLIDAELDVLHSHRPYHESDHVLTHVYNLFTGGGAIEDIVDLRGSEAVRRILGTPLIPSPSAAGDFLRRFRPADLAALDRVVDEVLQRAWKLHYGRRKADRAVVDLDSHLCHVYGNQMEGADFTYKGGFGYHPLVISLAETQEVLRLVNRPGNAPSAEGAAEQLKDLAPMLKSRFRKVLVRGDSAFARQDIFDACEENSLHFAMVSSRQSNFEALAGAIPEQDWAVFRPRDASATMPEGKRRRGVNRRQRTARRRGMRDLKLKKQWVAEIEYQPARSARPYRLIVRRQRIEESAQGTLFELWRYRFVLTNLPKSVSAEQVVRETYRRCDQENVIEQLRNGIAAMWMPTGKSLANQAFLTCARLAHNLKAWLAMVALDAEVMRWEWKRFRRSFVYVAARVVRTARTHILRLARSHRFAADIQRGLARLQT